MLLRSFPDAKAPGVGGNQGMFAYSEPSFFLFWRPAHWAQGVPGPSGLGSSAVPPGSTIADLETGSAQVLLLGRRRVTHFLDQSEWESGARRIALFWPGFE